MKLSYSTRNINDSVFDIKKVVSLNFLVNKKDCVFYFLSSKVSRTVKSRIDHAGVGFKLASSI